MLFSEEYKVLQLCYAQTVPFTALCAALLAWVTASILHRAVESTITSTSSSSPYLQERWVPSPVNTNAYNRIPRREVYTVCGYLKKPGMVAGETKLLGEISECTELWHLVTVQYAKPGSLSSTDHCMFLRC